MADTDQGWVVSARIENSFNFVWMFERHPANNTCDPTMGTGIGEQCLVFCRAVRRFYRHSEMNVAALGRRDHQLRAAPPSTTFDRCRRSRNAGEHRLQNSSSCSERKSAT